MPKVSIIINCHNGADYLQETLDSVHNQTFTDYEIVFWDNKSSDGSEDIALGFGKKLQYFRSEQFLALGTARNLAIEKARGKYIALLDCDDTWLPNKLENQTGMMESDLGLALVYTNAYLTDEKGQEKDFAYFDEVAPFSDDAFFNLLAGVDNPIICSTVIFDRAVFDKVGGFRDDLTIAEEYDLFLKIARSHRLSYLDAPLAKLRQYENSYSRRNVVRTSVEKIKVVEVGIELLDTLTSEQAKRLRKKLRRLFVGLILAYLAEKLYTSALVLPFELVRKYMSLSVKLGQKTVI